MTQIVCENEFCIYQKEWKCSLESIRLDIQGNCESCIYVKVDGNALSNLKNELLSALHPKIKKQIKQI